MTLKEPSQTDTLVRNIFYLKPANRRLRLLNIFKEEMEFLMVMPPMVKKIIELVKGRVLGLFTSYKNLNLVKDYLRVNPVPYEVFIQGGGIAPQKLVEKFKASKDSVLLGTSSLWTGVDCPGETLTCVVIDKLPFPNFSDPVVDAIKEKNPRSFFEFQIPTMVIELKQGVGRLIRRKDDIGVVVLLDKRAITASYKGLIMESFRHEYLMAVNTDKIEPFLKKRGRL